MLNKKSKIKPNSNIETARRVLDIEINGLSQLRDNISENFTAAIETIVKMKEVPGRGRLIIAGIGKSGHIARKIVATMASTGTPAYFVHPGEASHGDLGMITENDVVLILSNSGESAELSDLIHYTRRFAIPLISITNNTESTLSKHSDITLLIPKADEACPNGLAPTTSTTMMLALGDALAVALLGHMGLTPDQFKIFHPGGKLGTRLLTVADLMIPLADMALIEENETMDKAILLLTEKNIGAVVVVKNKDKNKLQGIITDGDLKRHMAGDLLQKSVKKVMSTTPKTIENKALAAQAVEIMSKTPQQYLTSLIVTDEKGELAGIIRLQDCLQAGVE